MKQKFESSVEMSNYILTLTKKSSTFYILIEVYLSLHKGASSPLNLILRLEASKKLLCVHKTPWSHLMKSQSKVSEFIKSEWKT